VFHRDFRKSRLLSRLTREDETRPRSKLNFDSEARSRQSIETLVSSRFIYDFLLYTSHVSM